MSQLDTARPAASPPLADRIDSLTSLRFFAAAFVLVCHVQTSSTFPSVLTGHLFIFPKMGVTFFFMLSGFVLAWSYRPDYPARRFYLRRFARVWPVHAVVTILLFGVGRMLAPHSWDTQTYLAVWVAVLLLVQSLCPVPSVHEAVNPPAWTLSCEAFFYALFPLLRRHTANLSPRALRRLVVVLMALCVPLWIYIGDAAWIFFYSGGEEYTLRYWPVLAHLPEFVLGMALAGLLRQRASFPISRALAGVLVVGWVGVLAVLHAVDGAGIPMSLDALAQLGSIPVSFAVLGAFATRELNGGRTVLHHRALIRLGEWSYALYLIHLTVIHVAHLALGQPAPSGWNAFAAPAVLAVSVALAALLHYAVERPAKRLILRLLPEDRPTADAGGVSPR
jgi:peptidoglycan/LPS O-acetylase OafA/YrhL